MQQYVRVDQSATAQASKQEQKSCREPHYVSFFLPPVLLLLSEYWRYKAINNLLGLLPSTADTQPCDEHPSVNRLIILFLIRSVFLGVAEVTKNSRLLADNIATPPGVFY